MSGQRSTYWCSRCGANAEWAAHSLDPAHPLVTCLRTAAGGESRSCGLVPGISDMSEIAAAMRWHREQKQQRVHAKHLRTKLVAGCPDCTVLTAEAARRAGHRRVSYP